MMNLLQITSAILLASGIYPLCKFIRKQDVNMFDLLILFYCLNFGIIPITHSHSRIFSSDIVLTEFVVLGILIYSLLAFDLWWTKNKGSDTNLVNISLCLRQTKGVIISKTGYLFILIILALEIAICIPYATLLARLDSNINVLDQNYSLRIIVTILNVTLSALCIILFMNYIINVRNRKATLLDFFPVLLCLLICAFFPRRVFIQHLLEFGLIYYSVCRHLINVRKIFIIALLSIFLFQVYFPFYNVMRNNNIQFRMDSPVASLIKIVDYGIHNYSSGKEDAAKSADKRSMNLYFSLYDLLRQRNYHQWGTITWMEIDVAIPKALNPDKGESSERKLELLTKHRTDQADSFILEACADIGLWGSLYCLIIHLAIFYLYNGYSKLLYWLSDCWLISIYIMFAIFDSCWNIEETLGGRISWFFSSATVLLSLYLLNTLRIISFKRSELYILRSRLLYDSNY